MNKKISFSQSKQLTTVINYYEINIYTNTTIYTQKPIMSIMLFVLPQMAAIELGNK